MRDFDLTRKFNGEEYREREFRVKWQPKFRTEVDAGPEYAQTRPVGKVQEETLTAGTTYHAKKAIEERYFSTPLVQGNYIDFIEVKVVEDEQD